MASGGTDTSTASACEIAERRSTVANLPSKVSVVNPDRAYEFKTLARSALRTVAQMRSKRPP